MQSHQLEIGRLTALVETNRFEVAGMELENADTFQCLGKIVSSTTDDCLTKQECASNWASSLGSSKERALLFQFPMS